MINQLRDLREDKLLSCADVGKLMKKTAENIGQYERGQKEMTLNDAYILSRIYEVTLNELYIASKTGSKRYIK